MSDERAHDTASESKTSDGILAAPDVANDEGGENASRVCPEQQHLSDTYATLQSMAGALAVKMRKNEDAAAATKQQMVEEIKQNYGSDTEAFETYADFATVNSVIDSYNQTQDAAAEKLSNIGLLLSQPYFAKIVLDFKRGAAPKEDSTSELQACPTTAVGASWSTGARPSPRCTTIRTEI